MPVLHKSKNIKKSSKRLNSNKKHFNKSKKSKKNFKMRGGSDKEFTDKAFKDLEQYLMSLPKTFNFNSNDIVALMYLLKFNPNGIKDTGYDKYSFELKSNGDKYEITITDNDTRESGIYKGTNYSRFD
jgi:hypothetical protein